MEGKKYAAIYCRVSTKYQAVEGVSLKVQFDECTHEAKRYGYEVFDTFIDEGVSGTKLKRDRLDDLIDIVESQTEDNRLIDAIIVYDLSRLSRSIVHTQKLFKLFDRRKVKLISIKDGLTGENDAISRKIISVVLSLLNELFVDQLKVKVPAGMRKSLIENRRWQGGQIPLGYDLLPLKDEDGNYVYETSGGRKRIVKQLYVNEAEAEIIRIIFQKCLDGWGSYKIAKFLNENGFKTKKGSIFRTKVILDILHNKLYRQFDENSEFGTLNWGKVKVEIVDEETGKKKQSFRKEPLVDDLEGSHEYIIEYKDFEKAQVMIETRLNESSFTKSYYTDKDGFKRRRKASNHLFTNVLKCSGCGGAMHGAYQTRKLKDGTKIREVYYKCYTWFQSGQCHPNSLKEDNIKDLIMPYFFNAFNIYFKAMQQLKEETNEEVIENTVLNNLYDQLTILKKNKTNTERQINSLLTSLANTENETVKERYESFISQKNMDILNIENKIKEVEETILSEEQKIEDIKNQMQNLEGVTDSHIYFESLDTETQRELLHRIIKSVVIENPAYKTYNLRSIEYNFEGIEEIYKTLNISKDKFDLIKEEIEHGAYEGEEEQRIVDFFGDLAFGMLAIMENKPDIETITDMKGYIDKQIDGFTVKNKIQPNDTFYSKMLSNFNKYCMNNNKKQIKDFANQIKLRRFEFVDRDPEFEIEEVKEADIEAARSKLKNFQNMIKELEVENEEDINKETIPD